MVHIEYRLDSRFERVDNGKVEWYDLDFPNVIELHRKLLHSKGKRHHFLGCSVFDDAWLDSVSAHRKRPFLFLAEGFSMYCEEAQFKRLVLTLRDHFPGAELVFDAFSPLHIRVSNLQIPAYKLDVRFHWGTWYGREIENWGDGIRLIDDWGLFDQYEPRMAHIRWMRHIWLANRIMHIYHYRLGDIAG